MTNKVKDVKFRIFNSINRTDYLNELKTSLIVPILYPLDEIYSVGAAETIALGNFLVTPESNFMFKGYKGFFKLDNPKSIANAMHKIINSRMKDNVIAYRKKIQKHAEKYSVETWANKINEDIENTISRFKINNFRKYLEEQK
jgi:hypothetical protein